MHLDAGLHPRGTRLLQIIIIKNIKQKQERQVLFIYFLTCTGASHPKTTTETLMLGIRTVLKTTLAEIAMMF